VAFSLISNNSFSPQTSPFSITLHSRYFPITIPRFRLQKLLEGEVNDFDPQ